MEGDVYVVEGRWVEVWSEGKGKCIIMIVV